MDEATQVLPSVWDQEGPEEEPDELTVPEHVADGLGRSKGGSSLLDALRARRAEVAEDHLYEMEVPGYDGCIVLLLEPLRGQELSMLVRRAEASKSPDKEFNANADMLIRACRQVVGRETRADELRTIHPDEVTPVGLDQTLAELFGIEDATNARALLLALWDKVPSPEISIGLMAADYVQWCSEANREDTEAFVGESQAAPR